MDETKHDQAAAKSAQNKMTRLSAVALPAGLMTVGLFMGMKTLVAVDDFSPPEQTVYILDPYMEPPKITEPDPRTPKPPRPDVIDPPPRPPELVKDIKLVDMPNGGYSGAAPASYGNADFKPLLPDRVSAISVRTLIPMTPPVPIYPRRAATQDLEGDCDVHLSVSIRGEPFNVRADCSHPLFESAARKAVQKAKFAPQIRDGLPVTVTGVVYPLEFRLEP